MRPTCVIMAALILSGIAITQDKPVPSPNSSQGEGSGKLHVYRIGGDVKPPRALFAPNPKLDERGQQSSSEVKYQGVAIVDMIVDTEGRPRDVTVEKTLGPDLDKKAIEAVKTWRFEPATKKGKPVAVEIKVEVTFRLN
jgi:periplasmic protein TonB